MSEGKASGRDAVYTRVETDAAVAVFRAAAERAGLSLTDAQTSDFRDYAAALYEANRSVNLIGPCPPREFALIHLYDSVAPLLTGLVPQGADIIDVGCGAGLPGLALAMAGGGQVTLLDSTAKKLAFIDAFLKQNARTSARTLCARAEEAAQGRARETFDAAVSRAVAPLPQLCELCLPFVRVGGVFLAYKGERAAEEAEQAQSAAAALGGSAPRLIPVPPAPGGPDRRYIVAVDKVKATPAPYPRRWARINESPL